MKAHIGVAADSGVAHSLETSAAKLHDSQVWDERLHGEETSVWADKGYVSAAREAAFKGPGKAWGVMRKAPKRSRLHPLDEQMVIPQFLTGCGRRTYAATFSFWAGVMPPMPRCPAMVCLQTIRGMFGRSLL